jgi:phosphoribosyl-AMP cyclohydrolase
LEVKFVTAEAARQGGSGWPQPERKARMNPLEEGQELKLDFGKIAKTAAKSPDVIPVAVQHIDTREVILVAYTNELAFRKAIAERTLILWSTSRNELWEKGKTSGETFELVEAYVNCEQNSLLYRVRPRRGGICHTKNRAGQPRDCYYRRIDFATLTLENVNP